jgi:hypothetical protein
MSEIEIEQQQYHILKIDFSSDFQVPLKTLPFQ